MLNVLAGHRNSSAAPKLISVQIRACPLQTEGGSELLTLCSSPCPSVGCCSSILLSISSRRRRSCCSLKAAPVCTAVRPMPPPGSASCQVSAPRHHVRWQGHHSCLHSPFLICQRKTFLTLNHCDTLANIMSSETARLLVSITFPLRVGISSLGQKPVSTVLYLREDFITRGTWEGYLIISKRRAGEMAHFLKAQTALRRTLVWFPAPKGRLTTIHNSSSGGSAAPFWPPWALYATHKQVKHSHA